MITDLWTYFVLQTKVETKMIVIQFDPSKKPTAVGRIVL